MGINRNLRKATKAPPPLPPRSYGRLQFKYQRVPDMVNGDHRPYVIALVQADGRSKLGMFYLDDTVPKTRIDDDAAFVMRIGPGSTVVKIIVEAVDGRTILLERQAVQLVADVMENQLMTGVLGKDWFGMHTPEYDDTTNIVTFVPESAEG